jgi:hypothetical protein
MLSYEDASCSDVSADKVKGIEENCEWEEYDTEFRSFDWFNILTNRQDIGVGLLRFLTLSVVRTLGDG